MLTRTEWISCNACGADDVREVGEVAPWKINACKRCGLVYVNPIPFFAPSPEFSRMSLGFDYTRYQHTITDKILRFDEDQFRQQAELVAKLTGGDPRRGRFLDFGCGPGNTVHVASKLGWNAMGMDIDPSLVELGERELHANIRNGTLPDASLPSSTFDYIRLRDVIEHLSNPYEVLVEVGRLLKPRGAVLIATPNEDGLPTRARALLGMRKHLVATVDPPHHLHAFTPSTLERIVVRAGLQPVRIVTTTPLDPLYVTAPNVDFGGFNLRTLTWHVGKLMGMGSMLVCWAVKPAGVARNGEARATA